MDRVRTWLAFLKKHPKYLIYIFVGLLGILIIALAVHGYSEQQRRSTATQERPTTTASSTPSAEHTAHRLLDGLPSEQGKENLRPLAVMIDNHPDARPQAGLSQASLVYEGLTEGEVTRFMAIYADPTQPIKVGPIRSARTQFVNLATQIRSYFAHVGGSKDALRRIAEKGIIDIDQISLGAPAFTREYTQNIALEHTVYSSTDRLWEYITSHTQQPKTIDIPSWKFATESPTTTQSPEIHINLSTSDYAVTWTYNPGQNSYLRTMAGKAHVDSVTGQQITAKNIIIQTVSRTALTQPDAEQWDYQVSGTGKATIFHNGTTTVGTWKQSGSDRTVFFDEQGQEISFTPGTTWIHVVQQDSIISY